MSVSMTAKKAFTNPRISGPRPNGAVVPGDKFTTDWLHAGELRRNGLAEPDDEDALDREPIEALEPHNQLSVAEHRAVNERRARARGEADKRTPEQKAADRKATIDRQAAEAKAEADRRAAEERAEAERRAAQQGGTSGTVQQGGAMGTAQQSQAPAAITEATLRPADGGLPTPAAGPKTNAPAIPPAPGA